MPLRTTAGNHGAAAKGRGATINPEGRFERVQREAFDDEWFQEPAEGEASKPRTVVAIERAKSVISRHDSPDVGFSQSFNPYRGCAHGCVYCLSGDTPILMANGRTKPISEVRPGDEIYGTRVEGKFRRFTKTRVLDHWTTIKPAYRTTLEDGTELVSSGDHRFLSNRGWKYVTGAMQGPDCRPYLTTNNRLSGPGKFAEAVRETDDYRRGYLCGMSRGDATFREYVYHGSDRTRVIRSWRLALADPEALLRTQDILEDFGLLTYEFAFSKGSGRHRPMHAIRTNALSQLEVIRSLIEWPREPSGEWRAGYLAGIFDAEGSFSEGVLRITNTDPELVWWMADSLGSFGFHYVLEKQQRTITGKLRDVVRVVGGLPEHLRFFHTFRPAITRKLNLEGVMLKSFGGKTRVVSIEPVGRALRLYDISTGTGDFIANGIVSHNCFARPSHAYLGLSPGLDFETRLSVKVNAAEVLREEISKPGYRVEPLTIGVNTDAYQPVEREHRITRSVLELCHETDHPVTLITKSALIERDLDLLVPMARKNLVHATISITTLHNEISRHMEPRTSAPARRLLAVRRLAEAGIPVNVNIAPVIPVLTDHELEPIMEAAVEAGATSAFYNLMRLPWEVKDIFRAWLEAHFPLKAAHVMSRLHEMREGRDNDPNFGTRMTGTGLWAELLRQRYRKACARLGLDQREEPALATNLFRPPGPKGQGRLF